LPEESFYNKKGVVILANNAFGIDLGTNNIKIYSRGDDQIMVEKNMIAIENKKVLFAYGNSAFEMYEKAPGNIHISYPLTNGVIADIKNMETLVRYFVGDLQKGNCKPADFYIAVPTDVTDVEKRAFYDLIKYANVKAKKIMVVEKAVADGLGLDIDVKNSQGVLVVNVGFETTEISILSLGGIVLSRLIKTGGLKFDEAIRTAVRKEFSLVIGGRTSESVKISLKELEQEGKGAIVYGRDIVTGLPIEREIPTKLVVECLEEHFASIIDNVKVILERTPPELAADIYRHGIYLTGGASQISHLAERMAAGTGLRVNVSEDPITSVVLGLAKIIKDDNYKSVAYAIEGMSK
jgi:rod shape-determining protein MreB